MTWTKGLLVGLVACLAGTLHPVPAQVQHGSGSGQGQQQQQRPGSGSGHGQKTGQQQGSVSQERVRVRMTSEQRVVLKAAGQTANRVRDEARTMARTANKAGFDVEQARLARDRLRTQFQELEREHEQLRTGLTIEQHADCADQLREMDRMRDRLREQVKQLCDECDKTPPDRQKIRDRARDVQKTSDRLRTAYRTFGVI